MYIIVLINVIVIIVINIIIIGSIHNVIKWQTNIIKYHPEQIKILYLVILFHLCSKFSTSMYIPTIN